MELQHIDPALVKHCHTAATTCVLEAVKNNVDRTGQGTIPGRCSLDSDRIEFFWTEYQVLTPSLWDGLVGRGDVLPHVTDVSWRFTIK
ncbi:hypothetical protein GDO86_011883 [Hymenochirus boettgeri]|uniref:Uncharacterized protein n=1 Tax=Hymenochirus boettgeri TaxID=247094 RepID=A0A8T2JL80_9PIPI|nr:hypothetical protein GDO86_011883 [Hymenochirus boettgeri]